MVIKRGIKNQGKKSELLIVDAREHNTKVISEYIAKLVATLDEKDLFNFWTFADRSGFKKIKNTSFEKMQKKMKKDIDLYKNRQICEIKIYSHDNADQFGTWLYVGIWVITTDNEANMKGKSVKSNGCDFMWKEEAFKVTKFSFKLLEAIIRPIADNVHSCNSFTGLPILDVIDKLKKKGVDLSEHLHPLANLTF